MKFSGTAIVGTLAALISCIQAVPLEKRVSGIPGFDVCKSLFVAGHISQDLGLTCSAFVAIVVQPATSPTLT